MVCFIRGERYFLWRAVDDEGEVLDLVMQKGRDTKAALKLLQKLMRNQPVQPTMIVTAGLASYGAALSAIGGLSFHKSGRRHIMRQMRSQAFETWRAATAAV